MTEHLRRWIDLVRQVDVYAIARIRAENERLNRNSRFEHSVAIEIFTAHVHDSQQRTDVASRRDTTVKDELARRLRLARKRFLRSHRGDVESASLRSGQVCRTRRIRHVICRRNRIAWQGREFCRHCRWIIRTEDAPQTVSNSRLVETRTIEVIDAVCVRHSVRTLTHRPAHWKRRRR